MTPKEYYKGSGTKMKGSTKIGTYSFKPGGGISVKFGNNGSGGSGSSVSGGSKIGKTKAGGRSPGVQQWHAGMSTPF